MIDIVDKKTRSKMMSGIRGKNTKPEVLLRTSLHAQGYRYRLHVKEIPGKPDLVLAKYNACVFMHGCFWHRHSGCRFATTPKSNEDFWKTKFNATVERDSRTMEQLQNAGWRIAVIWECALKDGQVENIINSLSDWLNGQELILELPIKKA